MQTLILTLVGADKHGLLDSVAKAVYQAQGNWLSSNFAHMAGQFAGFVEIRLPEENLPALKEQLGRHPDLRIEISDGGNQPKAQHSAVITIMGNDKPGIVQELSAVLNRFEINILKFESSCESAPNWGSELFKAVAHIRYPDVVDTDELTDALEQVANDLVVDIDLA